MIRELNHVIDYIEEHLTDEISLETIADYAGVSDFHFRKVFFHLSGMTLSEYIKNRRLSEAGRDLLAGERVVDVATSTVMNQQTDSPVLLRSGADFYHPI